MRNNETRSHALSALAWLGAAVLLFGVLPLGLQAIGRVYLFRLAELVMIFAILATSLNLVSGTAGLMSFCHAAFYGIGAYTAALLSARYGTGVIVDLAASAIVAGVIAFVIAIPAIRLVRIFFVVATLAAGEIIGAVLMNWNGLTNGPMGIRGISPLHIARLSLDPRLGPYYIVAIVATIAIWLTHRLVTSYYGTTLRALREDDVSASAMGINVGWVKLSAFAIGGGFAGVAGSLQAHLVGYISPDMFELNTSILILTMVVVGGLGSVPGAVLGACILTLVPELAREFGHFRMVIIGVVLLFSILLMPKGLVAETWALRKIRSRRRETVARWLPRAS